MQVSHLTEVKDQKSNSIWKLIDENALGQPLHTSKGSKVATYEYFDNKHLPKSITAQGVMDYAYGFFSTDNNLQYREDRFKEVREDFTYEAHKRLSTWSVTKDGVTTPYSMNFDATTGNITNKSDLGQVTFKYGKTGKPHAIDSIVGAITYNFPTASLNVNYTDFKKIAKLTEGNKSCTLSYGVDDQRRMSIDSVGGVRKLTRYYLGDYEEEIDATGNVRKIHYLSGAILIQNHGVDSLLYTYSDYQGSLIALTDKNGNMVERYAYDPWGARRDSVDWTQKDARTHWIINRGYTGHEHLDAYGIINMNGRVYDPATAMFFSPDPYVQAPDNWLNYNRYGYCYGNPFKYTDPSGEVIFTALAAFFCPALIPLGIAMDQGAMTQGGLAMFNGKSFMSGAWKGAVVGAATYGAGAGVGGLLNNVGLIPGAASGALSGGAAGFVGGAANSWLNGESFEEGMQAGGKGLLYGAATGFVLGGLSGMEMARKYKLNPYTGLGTADVEVSKLPSATGKEKVPYGNNKLARSIWNKTFQKRPTKGLAEVKADGSVPPKSGYTRNGMRVFNRKGVEVAGTTTRRGMFSRLSDVYLYEAAFQSSDRLYVTMGHEYIHVELNYRLLLDENLQEHSAYDWSAGQENALKLPVNIGEGDWYEDKWYNPKYDWRRFFPNPVYTR